jgi:hypothetical protein
MFHFSDEEHSGPEDHGGTSRTVTETSPFLSRSANTSKLDTGSGSDHPDDPTKMHVPGTSSMPAPHLHLETVEEAAETPSDLTNTVLDQLRDLRAGASSVASSVVHAIKGSKH